MPEHFLRGLSADAPGCFSYKLSPCRAPALLRTHGINNPHLASGVLTIRPAGSQSGFSAQTEMVDVGCFESSTMSDRTGDSCRHSSIRNFMHS
jgi:hypothetical protein